MSEKTSLERGLNKYLAEVRSKLYGSLGKSMPHRGRSKGKCPEAGVVGSFERQQAVVQLGESDRRLYKIRKVMGAFATPLDFTLSEKESHRRF